MKRLTMLLVIIIIFSGCGSQNTVSTDLGNKIDIVELYKMEAVPKNNEIYLGISKKNFIAKKGEPLNSEILNETSREELYYKENFWGAKANFCYTFYTSKKGVLLNNLKINRPIKDLKEGKKVYNDICDYYLSNSNTKISLSDEKHYKKKEWLPKGDKAVSISGYQLVKPEEYVQDFGSANRFTVVYLTNKRIIVNVELTLTEFE